MTGGPFVLKSRLVKVRTFLPCISSQQYKTSIFQLNCSQCIGYEVMGLYKVVYNTCTCTCSDFSLRCCVLLTSCFVYIFHIIFYFNCDYKKFRFQNWDKVDAFPKLLSLCSLSLSLLLLYSLYLRNILLPVYLFLVFTDPVLNKNCTKNQEFLLFKTFQNSVPCFYFFPFQY